MILSNQNVAQKLWIIIIMNKKKKKIYSSRGKYNKYIYNFYIILSKIILFYVCKAHMSTVNKTASRIGPRCCPTRQTINAWFSQHQSSIPSRKFMWVSRERYIIRSRGSRRCLLEAFTAFRLSIKDKVSGLSLFRLTVSCPSHSEVETLTRIPLSPWRNIVYTVRRRKRTGRARKNCYWETRRSALNDLVLKNRGKM